MKTVRIDQILDLRGVGCPLNYVKMKLELERLKVGQILQILVDDGEPILSVTRSAKEDGHKVLEVEQINGYFKVLLKKRI